MSTVRYGLVFVYGTGQPYTLPLLARQQIRYHQCSGAVVTPTSPFAVNASHTGHDQRHQEQRREAAILCNHSPFAVHAASQVTASGTKRSAEKQQYFAITLNLQFTQHHRSWPAPRPAHRSSNTLQSLSICSSRSITGHGQRHQDQRRETAILCNHSHLLACMHHRSLSTAPRSLKLILKRSGRNLKISSRKSLTPCSPLLWSALFRCVAVGVSKG